MRNNINLLKNIKMQYVAIIAICAYAIIAVASDIFANKMIMVAGLTLAGGTMLVPFSFTIRDLMHRCLGYENTKRIVWVTAILNLVIAALMILLDILPAAVPGMGEAWHEVMGSSWRVIIASFIAQLISDLADTYVFEAFTRKMGDKHTWLRVAMSNLVSVPLDTVLFSVIAFAGILPWEVVIANIICQTIVKYVVSVAATPIAYLTNRVK